MQQVTLSTGLGFQEGEKTGEVSGVGGQEFPINPFMMH